MRDLVIYGAGYPDVVKLVRAINRAGPAWNLVGVIDDQARPGSEFMGLPILGSRDSLPGLARAGVAFINNVCATMAARRSVTAALEAAGCPPATLVHPAVDTAFCEIGHGVLIADGAVLGANVRIGPYCAIRCNAVVNHDNTLEDHVFIGPGATLCGRVSVGSGAYVGAGSVVKQRVTIGAGSTVGAGAVVVRPVPPGVTVVGVPAEEK